MQGHNQLSADAKIHETQPKCMRAEATTLEWPTNHSEIRSVNVGGGKKTRPKMLAITQEKARTPPITTTDPNICPRLTSGDALLKYDGHAELREVVDFGDGLHPFGDHLREHEACTIVKQRRPQELLQQHEPLRARDEPYRDPDRNSPSTPPNAVNQNKSVRRWASDA